MLSISKFEGSINKLNIPNKLLLGPGPSNTPANVLEVLSNPQIGHMDPLFINIMEEVKSYLKYIWQTKNKFTFPISGTGSAGMECCAANLVESGDKVLICMNGYFGLRFKDMCERQGGIVYTIEREWGECFTDNEIENGIVKYKPQLLFIVHAETSTGVCQPMENVGKICRKHDVLLCVDTVTSFSGIELHLDKWLIDACYTGTQKCVNCPPGLSPVSFSDRALEKIRKRKHTSTWYLDVKLLEKYIIGNDKGLRSYHHTAPISMIYALHESLRFIIEEGLEKRWARHLTVAKYFWKQLNNIGLELLVDEKYRLPSLTTVVIPNGVDGKKVSNYLMDNYNIEIAGGLGILKGKVWRVGLMGVNANKEIVDILIPRLKEAIDKFSKIEIL